MKIPQIKKTIKSFILSEQGKIAKSSLIKLGIYSFMALQSVISIKGDAFCKDMGPNKEEDSLNAHCNDGCWNLHENCHANGGYNIEFKPKEIEGYELFEGDFESAFYDDIDFSGGCWSHQSASWANVEETLSAPCHLNEISLKSGGVSILAEHSHAIKDCGATLSITGDEHCSEPPCHASGACHLNYYE